MAKPTLHFEADLEITRGGETALRVTSDGGTLVANICSNRHLWPLLQVAKYKWKLPGLPSFFQAVTARVAIPVRYQLKSVTIAELDEQAPPSFLLKLAGLGKLPVRIYPLSFLRAWVS